MTDLVEFLTARYDEAESGWRAHRRAEVDGCIKPVFHFGRPLAEEMLADIAAKRAIVKAYVDSKEWLDERHWDEYAEQASGLQTALELLASVYSDHPDYNPEWKP